MPDFYNRYRALYGMLLEELKRSTKVEASDTPVRPIFSSHRDRRSNTSEGGQTFDLQSSLFSTLMLLSLLQTPDLVDVNSEVLSAPFIPLVLECTRSRIWRVCPTFVSDLQC
jgi:hypothetical protein